MKRAHRHCFRAAGTSAWLGPDAVELSVPAFSQEAEQFIRAGGRPIVRDPAAWSNASVRRVYNRAQFERVWLRGSAGTVYVIHPPDVPLPPQPSDATANW